MSAGDVRHREAYCLMRYRTDDGRTEELIWNSRDGVTPFICTHRDGRQMQHIDWASDVPSPAHTPKPGDLVFMDMTEEFAGEAAARNVERWWNDPKHPMREFYASKEEAVAKMVKEYTETPGQPTLRVVAPEGWPATAVLRIA